MPTERSAEPETLYRRYTVSRKDREPLVRFMTEALTACGCRIICASDPSFAPFRISFETPEGERMGVVAYAFLANQRVTKNRPDDEYRFQLKYGRNDKQEHELWQDPHELYTTLLLGISPNEQFFVGYDPFLHSPTKHFISLEFKEAFVERIQASGWAQEERQHRSREGLDEPWEIVVGGTQKAFLDYVRFEREAVREDQGHRALLAESPGSLTRLPMQGEPASEVNSQYVHALSAELELTPDEVLNLIAETKRLKMAVRGWVAEEHLVRQLRQLEGVTECNPVREEGGPDIALRFEGSDPLTVECKNVLRATKAGLARVDFQRTRTSKADPCSRYYSPQDFDIVAACLHALTQKWEYSFASTRVLASHNKCPGKLSNNVVVDERWNREIRGILGRAARGQG